MSISIIWSAMVVTSLLVVVGASPLLFTSKSTDQLHTAPVDSGQTDVIRTVAPKPASATDFSHSDVTLIDPLTFHQIQSNEIQTKPMRSSNDDETINSLNSRVAETNSNETQYNDIESNLDDPTYSAGGESEMNIPAAEANEVEPNVTQYIVLQSNFTQSNMTQSNVAQSNVSNNHTTHSNPSLPGPSQTNLTSANATKSSDIESTDIETADKVSADSELFAPYQPYSVENDTINFNQSLVLDDQLLQRLMLQLRTDPRVGLTVPELMKYYGYASEIHHVVTKDGYILELHRVLGRQTLAYSCASTLGRLADTVGKCQPVLLQHGLLGTSSAWVMNEPSKALAYILSDEGYDVWMGNSRGNIYSLNHNFLDNESKEYWDFTFSEMGKYDLPAVISYILQNTGRQQLHYVGHSMGTTMFWVMENEHPAFSRSHVASVSALGPVAYVRHVKSPIMLLAPLHRELGYLLMDIMKQYRFLNPDEFLLKMMEATCNVDHFTELICADAIFMLIGFDRNNLDMDWLPIILSSLNGGTSTKTIIHFGQMIDSGRFAMYDYGFMGNQRVYHQMRPPCYSLSKVTTPVMLKWGKNDWLAVPKDVKRLSRELTSTEVLDMQVGNRLFNHLDFLWGQDAKHQVYDHVIKFMKMHS